MVEFVESQFIDIFCKLSEKKGLSIAINRTAGVYELTILNKKRPARFSIIFSIKK